MSNAVETPDFGAVIDPDLPICDPHFHLWEPDCVTPPSSNGAWDGSGHTAYSLDDFRADARSGHNVVRAIYAECGSSFRQDGPEEFMPVGEAEFVARNAARGRKLGAPEVAGMVGMADLCNPRCGEVLDALAVASDGLLRGIRARVAHDDKRSDFMPGASQPPKGLMREGAFRAGVAELGRRGLTLDVWIFHPQLAELADVAQAHPETRIVVNHIGVPLGVGPYAGWQSAVDNLWRAGMASLAALPNCYVKLGGIGMYLLGHDWMFRPDKPDATVIADAMSGRLRFLIDTFGPERCMFESNFPVDRYATSYRELWSAFKLVAQPYSGAERASLFHDTAMAAYRIDFQSGATQ